jgi:hypothetical protein
LEAARFGKGGFFLGAADGDRTVSGDGGLAGRGDGGGTFALGSGRLDLAEAISSRDGTTGGVVLIFFFAGRDGVRGFADSPPDPDCVGTWMSALHFGHLPRLPAFSSGARKALLHAAQVTTMLTNQIPTGERSTTRLRRRVKRL